MEQDTTNEKAGSNNWKNKLEDAGALSSFLLPDKNAAWEKLHGRLYEQPAKKRAGLYWLAAACVLGLISITFILINTKQTTTTAVNHLANSKKVDTIAIAKPNNTVLVKQVADKQATPVVAVKTPYQKPVLKKLIVAPIESIAMNNIDTPIVTATQIKTVEVPVIVQLTATNTPEKKKLKVVHINELSTPLPELRSRTANDDYSVIQFNILNQHFFNTTPTVTGNTGTASSKQKNIPN